MVEGSINVGTSRRDLATTAGNVKVTPASAAWTEFAVSHRNGAVEVVARKGDINISAGGEAFTLFQGQSDTRDDSETQPTATRKKKRKDDEPPPAAKIPLLDSPLAVAIGSGVIAGGLIYVLTRSGAPVSPATP